MKSTKKHGRLLGLLFLVTFIAGAVGTAFRGLTEGEANTTEFLSNVFENTSQMKLAIGLDMLGSAIIILIAIFIFPFIKKYSSRLAIAYFGIACVNFAIVTFSNVLHITLISVSAEFAANTMTDTQHFTALSKTIYDGYYWTHFLILLLYSIGGTVLFYALFKTKLIAKWLGLWGLLASAIVFVGGALQMFGISVPFALFIQNGIFMLVFIGWLLAMGFRPINLEE